MARDEEAHRKMGDLLLQGDLSGVPVDDLVEAIKAAVAEQAERAEFIRRGLAALNQSGLTFDEIAQRTGINRSTANRWARDYL